MNKDTTHIASLDTGSTFNSTNNENTLADTVKAEQPPASKTNIGKRSTENCGETPDPTEQMWLDEMSVITIIGFATLTDEHRTQCDHHNGESSLSDDIQMK